MNNESISSRISAVLIPGIVFQSVITGGGFATGQEIAHYFIRFGEKTPLILGVVFFGFLMLFYLTAESARSWQTFDYRAWAKRLLGKYWVALDMLFIVMAVLVCAIVISGATEVLHRIAAVPAVVGLPLGTLFVAAITAGGKKVVVGTKIIGGLFLTIGYCLFAINGLANGSVEFQALASTTIDTQWTQSAFEYVGYNTVALPVCLYAMVSLRSRTETILASFAASSLLAVPILFVATAILAAGPSVASSPVPLHDAIASNGGGVQMGIYYAILVWTLLDTAVGMVFAFVGRIDSALMEAGRQPLSSWARGFTTLTFVLLSTLLAEVGIVSLVAKGYGTISYAFLALLVFPLIVKSFRRYGG